MHRVIGWAALAAVLSPALAPAQGPAKIYRRTTAFQIPVEPDDRANIKELRLHVKPAGGDWSLRETVAPSAGHIAFSLDRDGEYWLCVAAVDRAGRSNPATPGAEPPNLIVVVDTQPPALEVKPLPTASGASYVQCEVRDAHPDPASVKLEAAGPDGSWAPLEAVRSDTPGVFRAADPAVLRGRLRATAADKAGNVTVREVRLDAARADAAVTPASAVLPVPVAKAAPPLPPPPPSDAPAAPASVQLVNTPRCSLEYAVDGGAVGRVEFWASRDGGKTWLAAGSSPTAQGPARLDLPGDGVFALACVPVRPGGAGGMPPTPGQAADWWVEVDATPPAVQLLAVALDTTAEPSLVVTWAATDKHLGPDPVTVLASPTADGPWTAVARGLPNTGLWRGPPPSMPAGQAHLRVEVADRAGNVGRADAHKPIATEPPRPKVRVLGVSAGK